MSINKKNILRGSIFVLLFIITIFGVTYAFYNYTKTGLANTLSSSTIEFDYTNDTVLDISNDFPQDVDLSNQELVAMKSNHTGSLTLEGHNTLANGMKYSIYVVHGDAISGKQRLDDSSIKFQLVPDFTSGSNGFTVTSNNYANPTNLVFDNEGKALISTGLVKDTTELTSVDYNFYMWLDSGAMHVSSTMKRATLPEGNPSLADTTSGNTTSSRYLKNDGTLTNNVTLFPASSNEAGKIIYTTNEFSNGYYNIKFLVVAEEAKPVVTGESKVRAAILAKQEATTNSCNPIWVDDNGTANDETDDITYFSGTNSCVDMNYVWYSGKLWRITAIYPDGSMKLVTENNITSIAFNGEGQVDFYTDANTTSYMHQWLNEDFYDTLYNPTSFIDTTKLWNATNSNASSNSEISTKLAETTMVPANVGLLSSYEYYNSYRNLGSYSNGYLIIGYYWWLLNPYSSSGVWCVSRSGIGDNTSPTRVRGVRPSIYLKSGLEFTGNGTIESPYKIAGDKDTGTENELINTRMSGEYVKLVNSTNNEEYQIFRIIGIEDNKTKIIAMDYADNKAVKKFATSTGSANTLWGSGTTTEEGTWYTYLNAPTTGYFDTLKSTYGDYFDSATYYLGTSGNNYKLSVCANTTSGNTKVCDKTSQVGTFNIGLPRYGEMFATQQSGGYSNSINMCLMNRYSSSEVWYISNYGTGDGDNPSYSNGAHPTVHLKSTVKILSGSGTETDPYVVGL